MKYALLLFIALIVSGCVTGVGGSVDRLKTVDNVDLERYAGRWYEIARYQQSFERRLVAVTAEYTLMKNGRVRVVNSGFRDALDGPYRQARGTAWVPNAEEPGALKVSFFWPFAGDYKIFALDSEEYQWALVGDDTRNTLWFLARDHELSPELFDAMSELAVENGYSLDKLFRVPQKPR